MSVDFIELDPSFCSFLLFFSFLQVDFFEVKEASLTAILLSGVECGDFPIRSCL